MQLRWAAQNKKDKKMRLGLPCDLKGGHWEVEEMEN